MCEWGTTIGVMVTIPADLSNTGEVIKTNMPIDSCIAPIVQALETAGIHMRHSCCGHGKGKGQGDITLQDGRVLMIIGSRDA